jgi:hypothetical protein
MLISHIVFIGIPMADILKVPKEIMEFMYDLDKKIMNKFDEEKDQFMNYLRSVDLTPENFYDMEGMYPLAQSYSSPYGLFIANERLKKYNINVNDLYRRNSLRYRSDEFTTEHNGKHILFAGCSVTYGDSLPEHLIWPKIVYERISSQEKTSGFFNLGKPGASTLDILNSVSEYINTYGRPDVIFILFPDKIRDATHFGVIENPMLENKLYSTGVQMYRLLRDMMTANGGIVLSTSWDEEATLTLNDTSGRTKYYPISLEESFQQFLYNDLVEYIYKFDEQNKDHPFKDFILKAADLAHPGIAEHEFYANLLYNGYYEKTNSRD